ncbi:MAG: hypothetical protein JRI23_29490, partial [Deltaproteobacteria bacterium]|nr:hypothetical protein [Deltaproteobacteria bacterium]
LARWARRSIRTRWLVTDLFRHVDLRAGDDAPPFIEKWRMARLWTELLVI